MLPSNVATSFLASSKPLTWAFASASFSSSGRMPASMMTRPQRLDAVDGGLGLRNVALQVRGRHLGQDRGLLCRQSLDQRLCLADLALHLLDVRLDQDGGALPGQLADVRLRHVQLALERLDVGVNLRHRPLVADVLHRAVVRRLDSAQTSDGSLVREANLICASATSTGTGYTTSLRWLRSFIQSLRFWASASSASSICTLKGDRLHDHVVDHRIFTDLRPRSPRGHRPSRAASRPSSPRNLRKSRSSCSPPMWWPTASRSRWRVAISAISSRSSTGTSLTSASVSFGSTTESATMRLTKSACSMTNWRSMVVVP